MVELNPQALLAALEANHAHKADPGRKGCGIEKAIRAYLSALPAPDDGLVERLEYRVENPSAWDSFDQGGSDLCREAATAIRSKAEQIERLTRERDEALENTKAVRGILEYAEDSIARLERKWQFQMDRAEAAEQQVQKLTAENERLREIVSKCAAALPNGAHINPKASLDFMAKLPAVIRSVCSALETQEGGK